MKRMKTLAILAALGGVLGIASAVHAAPLGAAPGAVAGGLVENVAFGCGPGFVPNRFGVCRPRFGFGARRFYGPRPFYGPRRFYGGPRLYGPRRFRRF